MLFKEVREMGDLFKSEAIGDLRNVPGGLLQQDFGLLVNATRDDLGRGLSGRFFQHLVEVIDVHLEGIGVVAGRPKLQHLGRVLNRELPFEQLDEQSEYARRGVDAPINCLEGLEFLAIVNEFQKIRTEQIILEGIVGSDF